MTPSPMTDVQIKKCTGATHPVVRERKLTDGSEVFDVIIGGLVLACESWEAARDLQGGLEYTLNDKRIIGVSFNQEEVYNV